MLEASEVTPVSRSTILTSEKVMLLQYFAIHPLIAP